MKARIVYNSQALQFVEARQVLTEDFDWRLVRDSAVDAVSRSVEIDLARLHRLAGGSGSLIELVFRVREGAPEGVTLVDLQMLSLNEGRIAQNVTSTVGQDGSDVTVRES